MNIQTLPDPAEIAASLGLDARIRSHKWRWRMVWFALAALLLIGGTWWYTSRQTATSAISYTTQPATRGDLIVRVQATGNIQPTTQVDVSSELSGVIRTVVADYNSKVKKGDVLAELDSSRLQRQLTRAQAALAAARAMVLTMQATIEETDLALKRTLSLQSKASPRPRI